MTRSRRTERRILAVTSLALLAFATSACALTPDPAEKSPRRQSRSFAIPAEALRAEPIRFELDVPYDGGENARRRLDLYRPEKPASGALPVIVFIHGGGWAKGNKSDGAGRLVPFVRSGEYAGVSVEYRLSDEARWPAQIHDCKAAVRWIRANAARYGLDAERIGVWGTSAGGHLALMTGLAGDVAGLEGTVGAHPGVSSRVIAVVNFFGVADLFAIPEPSDGDAPQARLIGGPIRENPELARAASPIHYITPDDPPVLSVHGSEDRTVAPSQSVALDRALRAAGVPSYLVTVRGAGHGSFGTSADDRVLAFFDRVLRGRDVEVSTSPIVDWQP